MALYQRARPPVLLHTGEFHYGDRTNMTVMLVTLCNLFDSGHPIYNQKPKINHLNLNTKAPWFHLSSRRFPFMLTKHICGVQKHQGWRLLIRREGPLQNLIHSSMTGTLNDSLPKPAPLGCSRAQISLGSWGAHPYYWFGISGHGSAGQRCDRFHCFLPFAQ